MLYTIREVAEILKTNTDYVHKLRRSGVLKCIKIGHYKVRGEELERFLREYEGKDVTDPYHIKDLHDEAV